MGRGDEQVLEKILFLDVHADDADAATALLAVCIERQALDVTGVGDGNDHVLFGDQVLDVEVVLSGSDQGAPFVGVHLPDLKELFLDEFVDLGLIGEDALEPGDAFHQVLVLFLDLVALETGELLEP